MVWQNVGMFVVAGVLLYLAVKKNYEPLLLVPIGFGAMMANLPGADLAASSGFHAEPGATIPLLQLIYNSGIKTLPISGKPEDVYQAAVHPDTLAARGLEEGAPARLVSRNGAVILTLPD